MVTISIKTLATLMEAAGEWSEELTNHIAPASYDFGDDESGESQEEQARDINRAFGLAYDLIREAERERAENHDDHR